MGVQFAVGHSERTRTTFDPQWSYGGFHEFITRLAARRGLSIEEYLKRVGDPLLPLIRIYNEATPPPPPAAGALAPPPRHTILAHLIGLVDQDHDYDIVTGRRLAAMMRECARLNVPLVAR